MSAGELLLEPPAWRDIFLMHAINGVFNGECAILECLPVGCAERRLCFLVVDLDAGAVHDSAGLPNRCLDVQEGLHGLG